MYLGRQFLFHCCPHHHVWMSALSTQQDVKVFSQSQTERRRPVCLAE